ncbi:unnamed protein product, partial [Hapterophycus canaliculatus]
GRRGVAGRGGDITQDAMAKVLHERWLSERQKAKTLESRLKESEARIGDLEEVRKTERKALADKEQDEEWLSYELRAYRARYSQLRDERDRLKVELDRARRNASGTASASSSSSHGATTAATASSSNSTSTNSTSTNSNNNSNSSQQPRHPSGSASSATSVQRGAHGTSSAAPPPPPPPPPGASSMLAGVPTSPAQSRPPSPSPRPTSGRGFTTRGSFGGNAGSSPSRRKPAETAAGTGGGHGMSPDSSSRAAGEQHLSRMSPPPRTGGDREVMSPENAVSEVGSEYDEVDYDHDDDREESEEGGGEDVNFAGVTSDLEAIREGRMPESMQLVARVNAEAGGKVSVFDRLASTTTESRRQKVNDRDQLHENLRQGRKAKQDAIRKRKDFKVVPGHLPGANANVNVNGVPSQGTTAAGPPSSGGGGGSGHVFSVADAIASLEGGRGGTH